MNIVLLKKVWVIQKTIFQVQITHIWKNSKYTKNAFKWLVSIEKIYEVFLKYSHL